MLSDVASLRRGRSAKSTTLEPGLSANFKERKPKGKAKPPAPPANRIPHLTYMVHLGKRSGASDPRRSDLTRCFKTVQC